MVVYKNSQDYKSMEEFNIEEGIMLHNLFFSMIKIVLVSVIYYAGHHFVGNFTYFMMILHFLVYVASKYKL